jgi:putative pyruvate formate lyase activating enzyme
MQPSYLKLSNKELLKRIKLAYQCLNPCQICPRNCGNNRLADEPGVCRVGRLPIVSSYGPHFGEEKPLVGYYGSGTIFFTYCNLKCLFCQNYEISHLGFGNKTSLNSLAQMMIELQKRGCHNINLVTPTHVVPQILAALFIAIRKGLKIPLVYNCGGYESINTLQLLNDIIDIYMPDIKYADSRIASHFSKAKDYPEIAKAAIKEMHRQVGDLVINKEGIAKSGLLVRHLVLPENLSGTKEAVSFLATKISPNTYTNVMDQYRPCFKAFSNPPLNRQITASEFKEAIKAAREAGLNRLDK